MAVFSERIAVQASEKFARLHGSAEMRENYNVVFSSKEEWTNGFVEALRVLCSPPLELPEDKDLTPDEMKALGEGKSEDYRQGLRAGRSAWYQTPSYSPYEGAEWLKW